jgi:Asp-tRNA(Asn)/Glu-tRNA(Gln) amidotransferase C subunit
MTDLSKAEIEALAHAVGLEIEEPYLTAVSYQLNAILEAIDRIPDSGLDEIEPLPIILSPQDRRR